MCDITHKKRKVHRKFTGRYKYPEWFSKEKYIFCEGMMERISKLKWIHSQSADQYEKRHFRIFFPNITITALSGIASFLSTSQFINNDTQTAFGITVGVLASVSALVQSVASVTRYSAKAESHQLAADEYNKLLTRLKFEMEMPNEPDFIDTLEESILEIQNKCKYFPPQSIVNKYYKTKIKNIKINKKMDSMYNDHNNTEDTTILIRNETSSSLESPTDSVREDHILININMEEEDMFADAEQEKIKVNLPIDNPTSSNV
jgi:hypothetical protein